MSSIHLWQYCKYIPAVNNNNAIVEFNGSNATDSFNYKAKMTGQTGNNGTKDVEIIVPLKYLSNIWKTLEMPLINLILTWPANCIIVYTNVGDHNATFTIIDTKFHVPVVALLTQDNAKLLQHWEPGFNRIVNWSKYLSRPELLRQNPNLNHLVEPSCRGVNRLFVLAFSNDTEKNKC